jgi:CubicO group peptidase (beta-lactamase class C family)
MCRLTLLFLVLALAPVAIRAQPQKLTPTDVEAFFDGLIPAAIERDDIAGVTVSIVRDGQVLFAKGYGYADVAAKKPVRADATLFRPGSISKLFTWTSVMQMVEQGKLDLDHDVNEYLDFKVPAGITMRLIMTHSTGLEDTIRQLFVPGEAQMSPLKQYLIAALPRQIFAAGKVPAYSNYATALAGYIVQRLSGEPFDAYAVNHIFKPLDMDRTSFRQPLPEALKPLMSQGYKVASEKAKGFEFVEAYPAGSVSTTALDMARFMMAHLNDGRLGDAQILKPETAQMMHTRQASLYPSMNAMVLGFYEESMNGHRVIAHAGDTQWFHSRLDLILDANTGLFLSQNSAGKGGRLRDVVFRKFMNRYFPPAQKLETKDLPTAKQDASAVAGYYMVSRREEDSFPYAMNAASQLHIVANKDGTITGFVKGPNGKLKKLHEVAPFVFRAEDSEERLAFRKDDAGNWEVNIGYPFLVFQRVSLLNHQWTAAVAGIFGFGIVLLAVQLWPIAAAVRRHYGRKLNLTLVESRLRYLVLGACLLNVLFVAGWVSMAVVANKLTMLGPALDAKRHFVQVLGVLAALGIPVAAYAALRSWMKPGEWWFAKVRALAVALALLACTWFAWHWQLLNFSTKY